MTYLATMLFGILSRCRCDPITDIPAKRAFGLTSKKCYWRTVTTDNYIIVYTWKILDDGRKQTVDIIFSMRLDTSLSKHRLPFIYTVLKGLGQIMLQENAASGILFLTGIFYGSPIMAIAALLAASCGTLTAKTLRYEQAEIQKGLYGFSAALVGVGLILFFKPVPMVWISIVIGSALATILQHFFIRKNIPVFTLPFVLVTWSAILLLTTYGATPSHYIVGAQSNPDGYGFALRGYGQVIFQSSLISGFIFFIGVFISSPVSALYGMAASVLAAVLSVWLRMPHELVNLGLFGYNAVLCAIVLGSYRVQSGVWVLLSILISVVIGILMHRLQLIQLTFPFVAACLITVLLKNGAASFWPRLSGR